MQKQSMSNLDYFFLCKELGELVGARLDNAYDYPGGFRLKFRKQGTQYNLVVELGSRIHLSQLLPEAPAEPTSFVKLLRSELENAVLEKLEQINFDRVLALNFSRQRTLVFEQLGKGNALLLDSENKILRPMRGEEFSSRKLRKGELYSPPPSSKKHPSQITSNQANQIKLGSRNAVAELSRQINLAPFYLEEALGRAGYQKSVSANSIDFQTVLKKTIELLEEKPAPIVYFDESDSPAAFAPFPLKKLGENEFVEKKFDSFSQALDEYYSSSFKSRAAGEKTFKLEEEARRLKAALEQQKRILQELEEEEKQARRAGEWIYENYSRVEEILSQAGKMLEQKSNEERIAAALSKKLGRKVEIENKILEIEF